MTYGELDPGGESLGTNMAGDLPPHLAVLLDGQDPATRERAWVGLDRFTQA